MALYGGLLLLRFQIGELPGSCVVCPRHNPRITKTCRGLDAGKVAGIYSRIIPDDPSRLRDHGKRTSGVPSELVERLTLECFGHGAAFFMISNASSGGNTTLSAGR